VLDVVGDLMLAGADFRAKFTCFSPVHRLSRKVLEAIFADREAYELLGERISDLTVQT
jgi:UDP-3-O-acyl-N-acetylglucosamine deacetylase